MVANKLFDFKMDCNFNLLMTTKQHMNIIIVQHNT